MRKSYGVATHTEAVTGSCDHSRVVEVGASLDLSGPNGDLGRDYLVGLRQAVRQVNTTGGILKNHTCLELLYKDDRGNARIGDQAVLDLVNDEVVTFLVAPFESGTVQTAGADLGLAGVPTIGLSSLDTTGAPDDYPMMFPVVPSTQVTSTVLARYATGRGWVAVGVSGIDDPEGRQQVADLRAALRRAGVTVSGVTTRPAPDASGPPPGTGTALLFVGGEAAMGTSGAVGADGSSSLLVPKGVVVPPGATVDPALRQFLADQPSPAGEPALLATAAAYDGVEMLAYAADSQNSTRAGDVRTFLENATYQGVLGVYKYSSTHHTGPDTDQLRVVPSAGQAGGIFPAAS